MSFRIEIIVGSDGMSTVILTSYLSEVAYWSARMVSLFLIQEGGFYILKEVKKEGSIYY